MSQKVSFTVRRPMPVSRADSEPDSDSSFKIPALPHRRVSHLNDSVPGSPLSLSVTSSPAPEPDSDSDTDDDEDKDELVDAFDKLNGAQRVNPHKRALAKGPLVIPALKNKDWRALARKRRTASQYVPPTAKTGADGSVGGMGTRDAINSGPVLQGLQLRNKQNTVVKEYVLEEDVPMAPPVEDETEDQMALRAILAGNTDGIEGPQIDIIPTPVTEGDAFKQDVGELPESASLADYSRVPVSQFGAAMLRGMGWKEGQAASRKPGKGMVEPYLPEARPALLGIGAKEQEVFDDGSKKRKGPIRPERRYVPVIKMSKDNKVRTRSISPRRGQDSSRSSHRGSPDRDYDDRGRESSSYRQPEYDERDRDRRRDDRDRDGRDEGSRRNDRVKRDDRDRRGGRDRRDDRERREDRSPSRTSRKY